MNREKNRGERIFEITHCPLKGQAEIQHQIQPDGPGG